MNRLHENFLPDTAASMLDALFTTVDDYEIVYTADEYKFVEQELRSFLEELFNEKLRVTVEETLRIKK